MASAAISQHHLQALGEWFQAWQLELDGQPFSTHSSVLAPVRFRGQAAMLKVALAPEEVAGCALMAAWQGCGVATVFRHADGVLLMARSPVPQRLMALTQESTSSDAEGLGVAVSAISRFHRDAKALPDLVPLTRRFEPLLAGNWREEWLKNCRQVALPLLRGQVNVGPLHGDFHQGNILPFEEDGWLAIDPKGLWGERTYDFANLICNPDLPRKVRLGHFERRVDTVARLAGFKRSHLLGWVAACSGLSAVWCLEDGLDSTAQKEMAQLALRYLAAAG